MKRRFNSFREYKNLTTISGVKTQQKCLRVVSDTDSSRYVKEWWVWKLIEKGTSQTHTDRFIYGGYSLTVSMLDCGSEGESSILSSHPKKNCYEKGIW